MTRILKNRQSNLPDGLKISYTIKATTMFLHDNIGNYTTKIVGSLKDLKKKVIDMKDG